MRTPRQQGGKRFAAASEPSVGPPSPQRSGWRRELLRCLLDERERPEETLDDGARLLIRKGGAQALDAAFLGCQREAGNCATCPTR